MPLVFRVYFPFEQCNLGAKERALKMVGHILWHASLAKFVHSAEEKPYLPQVFTLDVYFGK